LSWHSHEPIVTGREETDVAVDHRDATEILGEPIDALPKPRDLPLASASKHDAFGILANMNESGAEVCLVVELVAVQPDERPGEFDRQIRAERCIENGNDEELGLIDQRTPEKARIVKALFIAMRPKESVVAVNARVSSATR
jgi:hypothetical protein